ncbi:MAG: hypothetical protein N2376_07675, partial [Clostridia bacterium]|nr:hypothetical protein [Clostridia bacterium]
SRGLGDVYKRQLLAKEAAAAGFKYMAAGVHLKNWPAIRFWTKMGLDRITAVRGDSVIGADKFSVMALRQDLNEVL